MKMMKKALALMLAIMLILPSMVVADAPMDIDDNAIILDGGELDIATDDRELNIATDGRELNTAMDAGDLDIATDDADLAAGDFCLRNLRYSSLYNYF